jgi:hypothetical protein
VNKRAVKKEVFGVIAIVVVMSCVFIGCGGKGGQGATGGAKALVGTWEGPYGLTWSFTGNKFTQNMGGVKNTVPYKIKGNSLSTEYQGAEVEMDIEIDGDTLSIEAMGFVMEFERVK